MESVMFKALEDVSGRFTALNLMKCGIVLILMILLLVAVSIIQNQLKKKLVVEDVKRRHVYRTVFRVIRVLLIIGAGIVILQILGVNLSGLITVFGVILVLFVLAIKDSFQDIMSGLTIMTDKYFSVSDAVEFNGQEGIVIAFTARTTKIELLADRSVLSVANRNISQIRKLNHLVDIDLPLPYELNRQEAYTVLEGICDEIREISGVESCELKGTQDFGESAVIYKIRFFCEPHDRPDIRRDVVRTIQDGLEKTGISIPYRQLDIHEK